MFGNFVRQLEERRATKKYLRLLPVQLQSDYGHAGPYSTGQVRSSIRRIPGLSERNAHLAFAIFCDAATVKRLHPDVDHGLPHSQYEPWYDSPVSWSDVLHSGDVGTGGHADGGDGGGD